MAGISAFGAYIPQTRLFRSAIAEAHAWLVPALKARASGVRALGDWEEDAVTMVVEAARSALPDPENRRVDTLAFASTTAPFDLRLNAGIITGALDLDPTTRCHDASGSDRAALAN